MTHQSHGPNPLNEEQSTQPPDNTHCDVAPSSRLARVQPLIALPSVTCSIGEIIESDEVNETVCLSLSRQSFWLYYHAEETECAFVLEMGDNSPFFLLGCLVTIIVLAAVGVGMFPMRSDVWYAMVGAVVLFTAFLFREVYYLSVMRLLCMSRAVAKRTSGSFAFGKLAPPLSCSSLVSIRL